MRIESWNPNQFDQEFEDVAIERLEKAAELVKAVARRKCPVGTTTRPIYQSGPYANQSWTSRDAGRLRKSIRVVRKKTRGGKAFSKKRDVRVYAGHFTAYYAKIVEYSKPFLRPAMEESIPMIKTLIGVKE